MIYTVGAERPDRVEPANAGVASLAQLYTHPARKATRPREPAGLETIMLASRALAGRVPRLARCVLSRHLITSSPSSKIVESIPQSAHSSKSSLARTRTSHRPSLSRPLRHHHTPAHGSPMSLDALTAQLAQLSIAPAATVAHAPAASPAAWREALEAHADAPKGFELVKALVYKPKTAKTATPVPVLVIARESTNVPVTTLGKVLNLKELRFAAEDLLKEFFALDKDSREC